MRRLAAWLAATALMAGAAMGQARIISTAPSITEVLYALGLGGRVVGVTEYCRYPADAIAKPKIGTFLEPDFERILALKPDLVLVIKNPVQVAERLRKLGVRAEDVTQDSIADVLGSIGQVGGLTGRTGEARALRASIEARIGAVRKQAAGRGKKSVLFLVGRSPGTLQGLVGVADGTFVNELIELAGGVNVLKGSPIQYPKVSLEQVMAADPDVILDMGDFAHGAGKPLEPELRVQALWAKYPLLRAVRMKQVRQVGDDVFIRPGPRVGEAAAEMIRMVQGGGR